MYPLRRKSFPAADPIETEQHEHGRRDAALISTQHKTVYERENENVESGRFLGRLPCIQ